MEAINYTFSKKVYQNKTKIKKELFKKFTKQNENIKQNKKRNTKKKEEEIIQQEQDDLIALILGK